MPIRVRERGGWRVCPGTEVQGLGFPPGREPRRLLRRRSPYRPGVAGEPCCGRVRPAFRFTPIGGRGGWGGSGWSPGSSEKCGTWKGPRCRAWCVKPRRHRGPNLRENRRGTCTHSVDGQTEPCPGSAGKNFASFFFPLSLGSSSVMGRSAPVWPCAFREYRALC